MNYNEAEIQLMIALIELEKPVETPNNYGYEFYPENLKQASKYFRCFLIDWSDALCSLIDKGIIKGSNENYYLTEKGEDLAVNLRKGRPPLWYWYKEYYIRTKNSQAHGLYCDELFGLNLCQDGFSDMKQVNKLIEVANITSDYIILDLGCGNGMISEYISDKTGAQVYGIDYIPDSIEQAIYRTKLKESRLKFQVGNLDWINFEENFFDLIISIDTLYMPNNLDNTIKNMSKILKPTGAIMAFYSQFIWGDGACRDSLKAQNTDLGKCFIRNGLKFDTYDFSKENYEFMQRKCQVAKRHKEEYEKEGNQSLFDYINGQSVHDTSSFDPEKCNISRFLYYATNCVETNRFDKCKEEVTYERYNDFKGR